MTTRTEARAARDHGMSLAVERADRDQVNWSDVALQFIRVYALKNRRVKFIAEDVVAAALEYGLQPPPDGRAWGWPLRKAAKLGIIKQCGYGIARNRHMSPCPLWTAA